MLSSGTAFSTDVFLSSFEVSPDKRIILIGDLHIQSHRHNPSLVGKLMAALQSRNLTRQVKAGLLHKSLGVEVSESFFRILLNHPQRVLIALEAGENYKSLIEWSKQVDAPLFTLAHATMGIPTPIMKSYAEQIFGEALTTKERTLALKNCDPRPAEAFLFTQNLTKAKISEGRSLAIELARQVDESLIVLKKFSPLLAAQVEEKKLRAVDSLSATDQLLPFMEESFVPLFGLAVDAKALAVGVESSQNLVVIYVGLAHAKAIREMGLIVGWKEEVFGMDLPAQQEKSAEIRNEGKAPTMEMVKAYQYLSEQSLPQFFESLPPLAAKLCAYCGQKEPMSVCPCREVNYCGKACQASDWKRGHKTSCTYKRVAK